MSNERAARVDAWASEAARAHRRYHGTRKRRNAIRRATRRHDPWSVTVEDARETFAGVFGAEALATFDALMAESKARPCLPCGMIGAE